MAPTTPDWSEVKFCQLCQKGLNSAHQAEEHFSSVKHLKRSQSQNKESGVGGRKRKIVNTEYEDDIRQNGPGDGLGFDIDPELDQVKTQTEVNGGGQEKKSKVDYEFCEICNKMLTSPAVVEAHYNSPKHLKRLQSNSKPVSVTNTNSQNKTLAPQEPESKAPPLSVDQFSFQEAGADCPGNVNQSESQKDNTQQQTTASDWLKVKFCQLCQKGFNSAHQAEQHFSSIKHQKRLENKTLAPQEPELKEPCLSVDQSRPESEAKAPPLSLDQTSFQEPESKAPPLSVDQTSFQEPESKAPALSVDQSSFQEERADCHGNVNPSSAPPTPGTYREFREQKSVLNNQAATSGHFYCSFCNVALNSQTQIDAHRAGGKHKKSVAKSKQEQNFLRQQQIVKAGEKMGCKTPFHFVSS